MSVDQTIVALDQMNEEEISFFLSRPENTIPTVKIGLELYLKYGPDLVRKIHRDYKKKIFLDLKLHDIPKTVERAIFSLKDLPLSFLTVHLSGGEEMLKAALEQARESLPHCQILGVSFLTSLVESDLQQMFGIQDMQEAFLKLFALAQQAKIDGVICSAHEIALVKKHFPNLLAVTPGIRFSDEIKNQKIQDQKRVATPKEAIVLGANYIVIGRSLTKAQNIGERISELSY